MYKGSEIFEKNNSWSALKEKKKVHNIQRLAFFFLRGHLQRYRQTLQAHC